MLDGRLRSGIGRALAPIGRGLSRVGVTANVLTVVGVVSSAGTAWLIAIGELRWAVLGLSVSGLVDLLDGSVARTTGEASPRGAFFDSVTDRVSDAVVFGGCAWYLAGESAHAPVLAFAAVALAMLISYERARAEALSYTARGGLMERAERMVVLGVGLMFHVLVAVLWLMVVLMVFTAVQRFVTVWRQASDLPESRVRRLRLVRHRRTHDDDDDDEANELGLAAGGEERSLAGWFQARRAGVERRHAGRSRPVRRRTRP
ncbi:MAG TPA: CDP-alcohol phosphatidyltransferase family protein [Acidimicrobiia bacterium]|nr:CDP-alcohol phosphatidyltransferase family protein [Acidimicrobiia bacterium]